MTAKEIEGQRKVLEELLNERYNCYQIACCGSVNQSKAANLCFYMGATKTVEALGYDWQRSEDGLHRVFGRPRI